jgi:hypothetical protein
MYVHVLHPASVMSRATTHVRTSRDTWPSRAVPCTPIRRGWLGPRRRSRGASTTIPWDSAIGRISPIPASQMTGQAIVVDGGTPCMRPSGLRLMSAGQRSALASVSCPTGNPFGCKNPSGQRNGPATCTHKSCRWGAQRHTIRKCTHKMSRCFCHVSPADALPRPGGPAPQARHGWSVSRRGVQMTQQPQKRTDVRTGHDWSGR